MTRAAKKPPAARKGAARKPNRLARFGQGLRRAVRWALLVPVLLLAAAMLLYRWVDPPMTHTIWEERSRLGRMEWQWVPLDDVHPVVARSVVAAEDANFCLHWGFDVDAIKAALEEGANRGASTITQQTVKNVFLWQDRSWLRKALEAVLTPAVEAVWQKRRIVEVYLNVAEFGEGVFGIDAAARHYFGVPPAALSAEQAARLAVVLPSPRTRDPNGLSPSLRRRAVGVADGAATIEADGRSACFEAAG